MSRRGRGRPRREYRIRVRAERRSEIDYGKLARAFLEQAAIDEHRRQRDTDTTTTTEKNNEAPDTPASNDGTRPGRSS